MTEGCEDKDSLVRVRAQVMTRDDSSGGWVPMDGGGLSNVSVRKRTLTSASVAAAVSVSVSSVTTSTGVTALHASVNGGGISRCSSTSGPGPPPSPPLTGVATPPPPCHCNNLIQHEYLILGKRISDQTVVLSCTIGKDFQYNKVMPTFHHWRTGDQKFGLTFQTAADARAFDKGVRMAVEDLLDGLSSDTPALRHMNSDASEDDVFMTLDLPMERNELRSSSSSSQFQPHHHHHHQPVQQPQPQVSPTPASRSSPAPTSAPSPPSPPSPPLPKEHHLHRIHFMTQRRPPTLNSSTSSLPLLSNSINEGLAKDNLLTAEQLMWQQRDQELALSRERERATKEKERQRREGEGIWSTTGIGGVLNDHIELDKESYSYVQFAREGVGNAGGVGGPGTLHAAALHSLHSLHEYSYPVIPDPASKVAAPLAPATRRDSISSLKKNQMTSVATSATTAPMLPNKAGRGKKKRRGSNSSSCSNKLSISHLHQAASGKAMGRIRCKHCQDTFRPEENGRGACEYAPDCVRSTIDAVSCVGCAQCLLYHCYADSEGDFTPTPHCQCPCSCTGFGGSGGSSSSGSGAGGSGNHHHHHHHQRRGSTCCVESSPKRWFGLALLSLVVPCLWCYLPLRACYRCGVQCGCCGKPHEAA